MRMNVEGDRLSSLPDDLIHKVLSFLNIKFVIGTSVLSPRWKFIWTSMPYLNFSTEDFTTLPDFSKFVTQVLSRLNNLTQVYSVKLSFRGKVSQAFVKKILNYAICHNVQLLNVVCLLEKDFEFPLSLVSSNKSLKHLSLTTGISRRHRRSRFRSYSIAPTSTWELPALTTLDLHFVSLCDDEAEKCVGVFSKCANLKNLTLKEFTTTGSNGFSISHPLLSNLTLENSDDRVVFVNVTAPQLENLTIKSCDAKLVISTPELASLFYEGDHPLDLSTEGFPSLEKADICVFSRLKENAHQIISLLQHLHNVKFLKLNLEIAEILSSSVDLILHQPSPFVNLKNLSIYPKVTESWEHAHKKVAMSTELKSYLLDSSPGSTFTMVLREEIKAQKLLAELRVLLEKKDDTKTNQVHLERGKTQVESHTPKKQKTGGNMAQIKSGWESLGLQIQLRKEKACLIISKLQHIEELLANLPASNRAKLQPWFSSLCTKAGIAISEITDTIKIECDNMKIQCEKNQRRSSVCFRELATSL